MITKEELQQLKDKIDARLDAQLCEMSEGYDDSVTGFNEAWGVVDRLFLEEIMKQS